MAIPTSVYVLDKGGSKITESGILKSSDTIATLLNDSNLIAAGITEVSATIGGEALSHDSKINDVLSLHPDYSETFVCYKYIEKTYSETIAGQIERLQDAKAAIKTSIEAKGVTVGSSLTLDEYSSCIDSISGGGGIIGNLYGNGSDGDLTITSNCTLCAKEYNFNNLTICSGKKLQFCGTGVPILHIKNTFNNQGIVDLRNPYINVNCTYCINDLDMSLTNVCNKLYSSVSSIVFQGVAGCGGAVSFSGGGGNGGAAGSAGTSGGMTTFRCNTYKCSGGSGGAGSTCAGGGGGGAGGGSQSSSCARAGCPGGAASACIGGNGGDGGQGTGGYGTGGGGGGGGYGYRCGGNGGNAGAGCRCGGNGGNGGDGYLCKGGNGGNGGTAVNSGGIGGNGGNSYYGNGGNGGASQYGSDGPGGKGGNSIYGNGGTGGTGMTGHAGGSGGMSVRGRGGTGGLGGAYSSYYGNGGGRGGNGFYGGDGGCYGGTSCSTYQSCSKGGDGGHSWGGAYGLGIFANVFTNSGCILGCGNVGGKGGCGVSGKGGNGGNGGDGSDIIVIYGCSYSNGGQILCARGEGGQGGSGYSGAGTTGTAGHQGSFFKMKIGTE